MCEQGGYEGVKRESKTRDKSYVGGGSRRVGVQGRDVFASPTHIVRLLVVFGGFFIRRWLLRRKGIVED